MNHRMPRLENGEIHPDPDGRLRRPPRRPPHAGRRVRQAARLRDHPGQFAARAGHPRTRRARRRSKASPRTAPSRRSGSPTRRALRSACSGMRSTIRSAIRSIARCSRRSARRERQRAANCGAASVASAGPFARTGRRTRIRRDAAAKTVASQGGCDAGPQMVEARPAQGIRRLPPPALLFAEPVEGRGAAGRRR